MARTALARRSSAPAKRRGPSPQIAKLKARIASLGKRARSHASSHEDVMVGVGAAALFSYLEKKQAEKGKELPTIAGLDPALVGGVVLYLGGRKMAAGKMGHRLETAGESLLALGAARSVTRGSVKVEDGDSADDVEPGDDMSTEGDDDDDDDLSD